MSDTLKAFSLGLDRLIDAMPEFCTAMSHRKWVLR